ncbi:MAG: hypothetical protein OIF40_00305 [Mangrovicoccus sp.]|nr:hypothetical protein [Mangrovicoccus sp.]
MGFVESIRKLLGIFPAEPLPSLRQREEQPDEVLIFVVDESYDRIAEYVDWDEYVDEGAAEDAASKIFLSRIKSEFDSEFDNANICPGADLPAFVTAITSNVIPLIPWLMAVFFSGKPIVDNIEAWRTIISKIRPFFRRTIILNRNGAAVLAMDAVFEDMGGLPKKVVLHGYKPDYACEDTALFVPTEIEDPMPTLNLSRVKHVFHIEADGILFVVSVEGTNVAAERVYSRIVRSAGDYSSDIGEHRKTNVGWVPEASNLHHGRTRACCELLVQGTASAHRTPTTEVNFGPFCFPVVAGMLAAPTAHLRAHLLAPTEAAR